MTMIVSMLTLSGCVGRKSNGLQPVYVLEGDNLIILPEGTKLTWGTNTATTVREGVFASHEWLERVRQMQVERLEQ